MFLTIPRKLRVVAGLFHVCNKKLCIGIFAIRSGFQTSCHGCRNGLGGSCVS